MEVSRLLLRLEDKGEEGRADNKNALNAIKLVFLLLILRSALLSILALIMSPRLQIRFFNRLCKKVQQTIFLMPVTETREMG